MSSDHAAIDRDVHRRHPGAGDIERRDRVAEKGSPWRSSPSGSSPWLCPSPSSSPPARLTSGS